MKINSKTHTITLQWRAFYREYIYAVLLIPVFGFGFYRLYRLQKVLKNTKIVISDDDVRKITEDSETCIRLGDVEKISVIQAGWDERARVARLYIASATQEIVIPGLTNAHQLESILDRAVIQEKKRRALQQELQAKRPSQKPGSLEKMNDLVGLWQQGLLTEEQFEEERKKFES